MADLDKSIELADKLIRDIPNEVFDKLLADVIGHTDYNLEESEPRLDKDKSNAIERVIIQFNSKYHGIYAIDYFDNPRMYSICQYNNSETVLAEYQLGHCEFYERAQYQPMFRINVEFAKIASDVFYEISMIERGIE
jgi:hypothetical protein